MTFYLIIDDFIFLWGKKKHDKKFSPDSNMVKIYKFRK